MGKRKTHRREYRRYLKSSQEIYCSSRQMPLTTPITWPGRTREFLAPLMIPGSHIALFFNPYDPVQNIFAIRPNIKGQVIFMKDLAPGLNQANLVPPVPQEGGHAMAGNGKDHFFSALQSFFYKGG
jgi:hypothetical protein